MNILKGFLLGSLLSSVLITVNVVAAPYAEIEMKAKDNGDGTFTYKIEIQNQGPVLSNVATPQGHIVYTMSGSAIDAGGKLLNQDENIVVFGVDTGHDDISISMITNDDSAFHGSEEMGWLDSDGDGIPNRTIAWHLPFGPWPEGAALTHGESIEVKFKANKKLSKVLTWVGGSDNDVIWVDDHDMGEDAFGIFDGSDGKYLATFLERHVHVKMKKHRKHHKD